MTRLKRKLYRRRVSLSKYESALEAAYKEVDLEEVSAPATLDRVPDVIIGSAAVDIVIPLSSPAAANRVVRVKADGADVDVSVNGGTAETVTDGSSVDLLIKDSTKDDAPVAL